MNLDLSKLSGVITDGAPAMVGEKKGFVALLQNHIGIDKQIIKLHCIIHQQALCAKSLNFKDIMAVVVKTVDFILSRGLNPRQFQEFLKQIEAEYGDVTYFSNVRWLTRGKLLERVYALREEISMFLESKEQDNSHFQDPQWVGKLAFLVDITTHMNTLNLKLQGKKKVVFEMFGQITAFERKLQLESQLQKGNYFHFPSLQNHKRDLIPDIFVSSIKNLSNEFSSRFADFRKYRILFKLFGTPYETDVEQVAEEYQLELIDLQCNESLKSKFHFHKKYILPSGKYKNIMANAKLMMSLFGSTYACEQLFSKMKYTKSHLRTRLRDDHLDDVLLLSSTNILPDVEKLPHNKQKQVSH